LTIAHDQTDIKEMTSIQRRKREMAKMTTTFRERMAKVTVMKMKMMMI